PEPEPEPQPPPPAPAPQQEPQRRIARPTPPEHFTETLAQRNQRLDQSLALLEDYRTFRSSRKPDEDAIPNVAIKDWTEAELVDLIGFFDILPFAYRQSDPGKGYITIDFDRRDFVISTNFDYLGQRYARNFMRIHRDVGHSPMLRSAAGAISQKFKIPRNDLQLRLAVPRKLMAYLRWRSYETCREAGLDPSTVSLCEGRIGRRGDTFHFAVKTIRLKDGRAFAWSKP
ncbi:MAG TPA: hypothetical protein DEA08_25655, partial [Planctomycetes bacterium]|nr:hypothetical protein [Planctomycetota bacterium]